MDVSAILDGKMKCVKCDKVMTIEYRTYPSHECPCLVMCLSCGFWIRVDVCGINDSFEQKNEKC